MKFLGRMNVVPVVALRNSGIFFSVAVWIGIMKGTSYFSRVALKPPMIFSGVTGRPHSPCGEQ
jgi:hypothetical protein